MEPRKNVLTVCKGELFEISMMSNSGSTGYDWFMAEMSGPILFVSEYNQVVGEPQKQIIVGKPHKKIFTFIAQETGEAKVVFKHLRPWMSEDVVAVNEYTIKIEESHSQDELKKFVNEDKFPKTPILKYGFIPTDAHHIPYTFYGFAPKENPQQSGQIPVPDYGVFPPYGVYPLYGVLPKYGVKYGTPLMPYGVYGGNESCCDTQDLRVVNVHESDSRCLLKYGSPDPFNLTPNENCGIKYGFIIDVSKMK